MVQGNCAAKGNSKGNHGGGSRRPSSHRSRKCNLNRNGNDGRKTQQPGSKQGQDAIKEEGDEEEQENYEPFPRLEKKHQQIILNIFRDTFSDVLFSDTFTSTLQAVKQALYEREFAKAFGDPEYLAVYATRWSPTRALCYSSILGGIRKHLDGVIVEEEAETETTPSGKTTTEEPKTTKEDNTPAEEEDPLASQTTNLSLSEPPSQKTTSTVIPKLNILSIGGGPAELVALGSFLNQQTPLSSPSLSGSITLLDSAPYAPLLTRLETSLTATPPISKYASAAAKAANVPLLSPASRISSKFIQRDALELGKEGFTSVLESQKDVPILATLLFTLNELFTSSGIGATTKFLLDLTASLPLNSLLLVVDSPGSYSETAVGKDASKKYPMAWLLDRVLLAADPKTGKATAVVDGRKWRKLETRKSSWFRLAEGRGGEPGLDYPIGLENMRYQLHLYRLVDEDEPEEEEEEKGSEESDEE
ncbi:hypothetical protein SMACR_04019 [Sordaria macrospora]|uniref:WGS project CABT00000000 data, contig 2.17 n=2 Tax=Sordaria macrospora TaxID=5147 RepID=F7W0L6_SORMK|nr:uncharacterized protein SMAC_04019 [Sordaria macrospora k-hell]KAA8631289.1 hypothetical protein SMACR_04019 [Sordaria macrospora]KAH7633353.1 hypothetical protein B0T09DRAFT_333640 [Sordaria sp. MPI-SDFR-AT-0083]WPJ60239.1 hypothetical protein SMAC4_04019 [Sordaria macrospora]CCC11316.1 unnamed protein product [Sordaria macrospora k-hell]